MGMGFSIIVSKEDANETLKILKKNSKSEVKIIGEIKKGNGIELKKLNLKY
jgi:phosphoribosylaminoimidazole (AIR) synthetase